MNIKNLQRATLKKLWKLRPAAITRYQICLKSADSSKTSAKKKSTNDEKQPVEENSAKNASKEPQTTCCQSGCNDCGFVDQAEAILAKMQSAGPEEWEKILNTVEDPSLKAYLELEIRLRGSKK